MIDLSNSAAMLAFIQTQGYLILFLIMFLEGPIITYAAAFLASQGIFNVWIVFLLSVFGNVIPDTILFLSGQHSRTKTIEKISAYFGMNESRIQKMEKGFYNHTGKSIILFKFIPGLAIPGLMLAGFSKVPFKKFFIASTIFNVSSAIIFTLLGFYSGITISSFLKYLKLEKYILIILVVSVISVYFIIRYINLLLKLRIKD
jgi:membrane protein DedA with SNARE-associated domain